jgi:hypothetical protein
MFMASELTPGFLIDGKPGISAGLVVKHWAHCSDAGVDWIFHDPKNKITLTFHGTIMPVQKSDIFELLNRIFPNG